MERIDIERRFGSAVRHWRERLHISQDELARRSGLHRTYISDVERGSRNVSLKSVEKLADGLGVTVLTLFSHFAEKPATQPLTTDEMVDILLVEDRPEDVELTLEALKSAHVANRFFTVNDGAAALDFLFGTGTFAHRRPDDHPQIILLDLNLPKIDGLEVLRRVKSDARTRNIPVVVLTSSKNSRDIVLSKQLGASTYIVKPVDFQNFSAVALQLSLHWALLKPPELTRA